MALVSAKDNQETTGLDIASPGDAEGVRALVGLDASTCECGHSGPHCCAYTLAESNGHAIDVANAAANPLAGIPESERTRIHASARTAAKTAYNNGSVGGRSAAADAAFDNALHAGAAAYTSETVPAAARPQSAKAWLASPIAPPGRWVLWHERSAVVLERGAGSSAPQATRVVVGAEGEVEVYQWLAAAPLDAARWLREGPFPRWELTRAGESDWAVWDLVAAFARDEVTDASRPTFTKERLAGTRPLDAPPPNSPGSSPGDVRALAGVPATVAPFTLTESRMAIAAREDPAVARKFDRAFLDALGGKDPDDITEAEAHRARDIALRSLDRESLGRIVRDVWIAWAREQPNPKPSWLVPWEGLSEPDKEVDRRIGERLWTMGASAGVPATGTLMACGAWRWDVPDPCDGTSVSEVLSSTEGICAKCGAHRGWESTRPALTDASLGGCECRDCLRLPLAVDRAPTGNGSQDPWRDVEIVFADGSIGPARAADAGGGWLDVFATHNGVAVRFLVRADGTSNPLNPCRILL